MNIFGYFGYIFEFINIGFGFEAVRFISKGKITFLEMISFSFPFSFAFSSIIGLLFNFIIGCTFIHLIIQSILFILLSLILHKLNSKKTVQKPKFSIISIIGFITMTFFAFYVSSHLFPEKGSAIRAFEKESYLEVSLISSFSKGCNKWRGFLTGIKNPLSSGSLIFSDYIPPYHTALLKSCGLSLPKAITIDTFLLFFFLFFLEYNLTLRYTKSEYAAVLSMPTVVLIGGFDFKYFVNQHHRKNQDVDYVHNIGVTGFNNWGHPMLECFLVSRINLLCACFSIMIFLLLETKQDLIAGIYVIIVTFIRPQNGFILLLLFFFYSFNNMQKNIIFVPIVILLIIILKGTVNVHSPMTNFGITSKAMFPITSFLFMTLNFHFIGLILSLFTERYYYTILSSVSFILVLFMIFQPDQRYNYAIVFCDIMPLLVTLSLHGFVNFINHIKNEELNGSLNALLLVIVCVSCCSSLAGLYQQIKTTFPIWEDDETEAGEWISKNTQRTDIFFSPETIVWNPAVTRAGRQLYYTSQNWMPYISINNSYRSIESISLMKEFKKINNVNYLLYQIGKDWDISLSKYYDNELVQVYSNEKYIIVKYKD